MNAAACRGRFAPSPTGPLHFGSLVAAVASYLDARSASGTWLVRMEDLDSPRNVPGAESDVLRCLEECRLHWDGAVTYQSSRLELYRDALDRLLEQGHAFPCGCSRKDLADGVYPGTCRSGPPAGRQARAYRLWVNDDEISFQDRLQGLVTQNLEREVGDFVLARADGIFAYQLAVVVDDAEQGITHVVRGADLLDSTPRQIYLQRRLNVPTPAYLHVPVAANASGEKLSKQTMAPAAGPGDLEAVLTFLDHTPPKHLRGAPPDLLLDWAIAAWDVQRIPKASVRRL